MNLIYRVIKLIEYLLDLISFMYFFFILLLFVIVYNIFLIFVRDRTYLKAYKRFKDNLEITIDDLIDIPLVNIIIPAWKEGKYLNNCLLSITELSYPKIKAIVNAGGDSETIEIAESFKKYNNFKILRQMEGKSRAAFGKIKALNECIDYVSEGLIYFIDADCYVTDDILLRIIFPIVNENENVVINTYRPLKSQENRSFIKYLQLSRIGAFRGKVKRYTSVMVSGSNTCMTYKVLKAIGKFSENRLISEDCSRGYDIISKNFKIYCLFDYRSRMYSAYPDSLKEYFKQRKRYIENSLLLSHKKRNIKYFVKFFVMILVSIYLLITPFLLVLHFGLFLLGIIIFIYIYLIKIRKYLFFNKMVANEYQIRVRTIFFVKIIFYIYFEILVNVFTFFNLLSFVKKLKKMN